MFTVLDGILLWTWNTQAFYEVRTWTAVVANTLINTTGVHATRLGTQISYNLHDSLILVPVLSVIVAALGVGWQRKALYFAIALAGFIPVDFLTVRLGVARLASDPRAYGVDPVRTVLLLLAEVFVVVYPLVVLILFVGSKPAVLWTLSSASSDRSRGQDQRDGACPKTHYRPSPNACRPTSSLSA